MVKGIKGLMKEIIIIITMKEIIKIIKAMIMVAVVIAFAACIEHIDI